MESEFRYGEDPRRRGPRAHDRAQWPPDTPTKGRRCSSPGGRSNRSRRLKVVRLIVRVSREKPVSQVEIGHHCARQRVGEGDDRKLQEFGLGDHWATGGESTQVLEQLDGHKAYSEGANPSCFSIDVEPEGDDEAVRAQLDEWEAGGLLEHETCEARVPGSFDDRPGDDWDQAR